MSTKYKSWPISQLLAALENGELTLPQYQRRGVWDKKLQKRLMSSIRNQWPIGSLLLARNEESGGDDNLLIDGQQRVTAIREFMKNPCAYLEPSDIGPELLGQLQVFVSRSTGKARDATDDATKQAITKWLSSCTAMALSGGFAASGLARSLITELEMADSLPLTEACERVVDDLAANWSLSDREIPIIFYGGDIDHIPEIFERINTAGKRLDKFDIYSAQWHREGTATHIRTQAVRRHIQASYEKQINDGMIFATRFEDRDPMLVEYLFGLSKLLMDKFSLLFGKPGNVNETDEVGFNVAATAHGLAITYKPMATLNRTMRTVAVYRGQIDPSNFEKALLDACDFTQEALKPILGIRLNKARGSEPPEILHNTSHIISMVCRVLIGKYTSSFTAQRADWGDEKDVLRKNLRHFYLEDILEDNWSGAAANTLWDRVWRHDGRDLLPSPYYLQKRERAHWERLLDNYHERLKLQLRTKGRYVQKHHKVFLKYAVNETLLAQQQLREGFQIEHLFPVKRLEELIDFHGDGSSGWPIDHVANLALFSRKLNQRKNKKTLAEYYAELTPANRRKLVGEGLNMLMCEVNDVSIPSNRRFGKNAYEQFLDMRFTNMKKEVLKCLYRRD
jgi:hypothetical protein